MNNTLIFSYSGLGEGWLYFNGAKTSLTRTKAISYGYCFDMEITQLDTLKGDVLPEFTKDSEKVTEAEIRKMINDAANEVTEEAQQTTDKAMTRAETLTDEVEKVDMPFIDTIFHLGRNALSQEFSETSIVFKFDDESSLTLHNWLTSRSVSRDLGRGYTISPNG